MPRPTKRSALRSLAKPRLKVLVEHFGVDISPRSAAAKLIDALAGSRAVSLAAVFERLSRDELKQICREHQIDDRGRAKTPIIARLLDTTAAKAGYPSREREAMVPRRMTAIDRRSVLELLTKARLLEVARRLGIEIAAGRPKAQVVDALARSRQVTLQQLLGAMQREELEKICRGHELDASRRDKQALINRLLPAGSTTQDVGPGSRVSVPAEPNASAPGRVRQKKAHETTDAPASWASSTKLRLQRFALDSAGGYRGGDPELRFVSELIRCFGWNPDDELPAEIPATVRVVQHGEAADRRVSALLRERRTLVEVVDRDHSIQDAWGDLLWVVLQLTPVPHYVVLTNQRDIALYDLARSRNEPRLEIPVDQLPKYSQAFPFLAHDWSPGATPQIINSEKVSKEVADLVARVYRSFKAEHPGRVEDVTRFTLQCILAMFAEDVELLPRRYFTSLLYEGAAHGDASERVAELFRQMSTPNDGTRVIRYFNGGLFKTPVTLPINPTQLAALTKAAEADWKYVEPHIFGNVFQGIMDDNERHATGAHYTAKDDIMRVVGPTIVEPWRKRISEAKTLTELRALRKELTRFRVLDPACGSGNFLYIAFRELYRVETEILGRMQEFASIADDASARAVWGSGIPTTNFYGIDINAFAVELARATLNIAKKIAFDERHEVASERFKQVQMDLDPSLPLDNLDRNIICADALFESWPEVEAIVGNPPFLGGLKIRAELGQDYLGHLQERFSGVNGRADLCAYWFRRAHDHLEDGGRAGLVATNTVREGHTSAAATVYLINAGGTITNAVSSRRWPGQAVVKVSMVNWVKGAAVGPFQLVVDDIGHQVQRISPHLQLHADLNCAVDLAANKCGTAQGVVLGTKAFQVSREQAVVLRADAPSRQFVRPVATAGALLRGSIPDHVIDMTECASEAAARKARAAFGHLRQYVLPFVQGKAATATTDHYRRWLEAWWRPFWPREDFFARIQGGRYIAASRHAARPIFIFLSRDFMPTESLQVFAYDDDYSFGILQSQIHWKWVVALGSKIKEDTRYTTKVWRTFPWPQQPPQKTIAKVAVAARVLRETRRTLMDDNGWSLRALYQAADVTGPHPLKDAQARLDEAVAAAYDLPSGQDPLEFLLELNLALAEDEEQGHPINGPGLPPGLDPNDPRWTSDDCIESPPLND